MSAMRPLALKASSAWRMSTLPCRVRSFGGGASLWRSQPTPTSTAMTAATIAMRLFFMLVFRVSRPASSSQIMIGQIGPAFGNFVAESVFYRALIEPIRRRHVDAEIATTLTPARAAFNGLRLPQRPDPGPGRSGRTPAGGPPGGRPPARQGPARARQDPRHQGAGAARGAGGARTGAAGEPPEPGHAVRRP